MARISREYSLFKAIYSSEQLVFTNVSPETTLLRGNLYREHITETSRNTLELQIQYVWLDDKHKKKTYSVEPLTCDHIESKISEYIGRGMSFDDIFLAIDFYDE